jgi:hypothetical protein
MIVGQTIVAIDSTGSTTTTTVYTPWISTSGDSAVFPFEIMSCTAPPRLVSFTARIYTRNSEQPDPGVAKGTLSSQTAPGAYAIADATGLLELVRFEFKISARSGMACVHFRPLNPSWKSN